MPTRTRCLAPTPPKGQDFLTSTRVPTPVTTTEFGLTARLPTGLRAASGRPAQAVFVPRVEVDRRPAHFAGSWYSRQRRHQHVSEDRLCSAGGGRPATSALRRLLVPQAEAAASGRRGAAGANELLLDGVKACLRIRPLGASSFSRGRSSSGSPSHGIVDWLVL